MAIANVVNYYEELDIIKEKLNNTHPIQAYLDWLEVKKETKQIYVRQILEFFNYTFGSIGSILDISNDMIKNVLPEHATKYKNYLGRKQSKNTVLRKIDAVKSMYKFFIGEYATNQMGGQSWLKHNPFSNAKVKFKEEDKKSYDAIYPDELNRIMEITTEKKALLYETAVRTCIRISALLDLTKKNIKKRKGVYYLKGIDKFNTKFEEPITNEMYEKFIAVDGEKLFPISRTTPWRWIINDLKKIGLTDDEIEERGLCFHSLKKTGVILTKRLTNGDLTQMQAKGHHKDIRTTMNDYNKDERILSEDVGLKMVFGKENGKNEMFKNLNDYSKDELLEAISRCDTGVLTAIYNNLSCNNDRKIV